MLTVPLVQCNDIDTVSDEIYIFSRASFDEVRRSHRLGAARTLLPTWRPSVPSVLRSLCCILPSRGTQTGDLALS